MDSHAYFLRVQGAAGDKEDKKKDEKNEAAVQAVLQGDLDSPALSPAEKSLLAYVRKVTEAAYKTTAEDVDNLRNHGWMNDQIAEAVYVTAMFAFFNRVADAFGIEPMSYLGMDTMTL